jgi:hypothetical protein
LKVVLAALEQAPALGETFAREALELVTAAVLERACLPAPATATQAGVLIDPAALNAAPRELGLRALAALLRQVSGAVYRPRFESLERLWNQLAADSLGGGATLSGCVLRPAPAAERLFGPRTLKLTPEKPRKNPGKARQSSAKIGGQTGPKVARPRQRA